MNVDENIKSTMTKTIPIEDIGVVVLDSKEITITQGLIVSIG